MYNIFLVCADDFYYQNRIFDLNNPVNRDDYYYPYYLLKKRFFEHNIILNTYDYFSKVQPKRYRLIFFDIPNRIDELLRAHNNIDKFLVIFESGVINKNNWNKEYHKYFKKIFTWNNTWVKGEKYIKFYWPNKIPERVEANLKGRDKLCTMIVANKFKSHPLGLYAERMRAIRWFEKEHPEDFELYGMGWDQYYFKAAFSRLNRFASLRKLLRPKHPSYKGPVKSKREVLQKYKFAICYENAKDIPGYITEKIFDCFFAGCVPVYLGAPNVADYIPANTFIDKRNFRTYEELYNYLKNIPDREYANYLNAIKDFVESDRIYPFSADCFAKIIIDEIAKDPLS